METFRPSTVLDIPRITELWSLCFGDGGDYLDNFFTCYYAPERVFLLEVDGIVQAMTTWYGSTLQLKGGEGYRCAYLYAVGTHPDCRGQGLAGRLLHYCDISLREMGFDGVTTVPARPDLHVFFGQYGFKPCFYQGERKLLSTECVQNVEGSLVPVYPAEYRALRERFLKNSDHIDLDLDGIRYQHGASRLSGGGMFRWGDKALLCTEYGEDGDCYVKEFLGDETALQLLPSVCPATRYLVRTPEGDWSFGLIKWLRNDVARDWDYHRVTYLGFAFD